ncbi:MAG: NADAR family protein [Saprospiraceae bacterium]|nr:NADAR family protein [Saprospiraceae bacterium]
MSTEKFTFFYYSRNPFSQWYLSNFIIDGIEYNCAEQYMMYQKAILFGDYKMAERILAHQDPRQQKMMGRQVSGFDGKVWAGMAKKIVYQGNYAKFSQDEALKKYILKTVGTTLVEASPSDIIWGIGLGMEDPKRFDRQAWRGTNWLGEVLMEVRKELLEEG